MALDPTGQTPADDALAALVAQGQPVPAGRFRLTRTLVVPPSAVLAGAGSAFTVFLNATGGDAIAFGQLGASVPVEATGGGVGFRVESPVPRQPVAGIGVRIDMAAYLRLADVRVHWHGTGIAARCLIHGESTRVMAVGCGDGIALAPGPTFGQSNANRFAGVMLRGNRRGLVLSGSGNAFDGCGFYDHAEGAIAVEAGARVWGAGFSDCWFEGNTGYDCDLRAGTGLHFLRPTLASRAGFVRPDTFGARQVRIERPVSLTGIKAVTTAPVEWRDPIIPDGSRPWAAETIDGQAVARYV